MQERLARKFRLLHTKQANVQFGDQRPQFNVETSMPRHEDTTPVAPHPMLARTSPKCSGQDLHRMGRLGSLTLFRQSDRTELKLSLCVPPCKQNAWIHCLDN